MFSNGNKQLSILPKISTTQGAEIEIVTSYKYPGIIIDQNLSFKTHIEDLVSKLRIKLGFLLRDRSNFSLKARKSFTLGTFLPLLDVGDLLYLIAPDQYLKKLDAVYHCALCVITGCGNGTHHYIVYATTKWPSLNVRRLSHWLIFLYKPVLGLVPTYLSTYMCRNQNRNGLRPHSGLQMVVPRVRTELGKKSF